MASNQDAPRRYYALKVTAFAAKLAAGGLDNQAERDLRAALREAQDRYSVAEGSS